MTQFTNMAKTALIAGMTCVWASASTAENTFDVTMSNGISFNQDSEKAKIIAAGAEVFRVSGNDGYAFPEVFFEPRALGRDGTGRTTEISEGGYGDRDMRVYFYAQIDGERINIMCQSAESGTGWYERSELTETRVSGSFDVEVTECFDRGETPVNYDGLPFTVSGEYSLNICGMFTATSC